MDDNDPTVSKAIWKKVSTNAKKDWPQTKRNFVQGEVDNALLEAGIPWFGSLKATGYYFLVLILIVIFWGALF
ncbi:hypothetical protein [Qipengyuania sphaerica]|uniref:hypothetical protein n=1 Tax=Qipengyuania sphaerica TaxID=2867243 RepID=UPI001C879F16|nr:hypothetical protein [Qipengyuania sphaerica]MBX7541166.1 hypothetical protein [Qipengyuania sphaerica]